LLKISRLIFTEWKKAPAELVDFIAEKMKDKNWNYKKMFWYPACFFNGNMFVEFHGRYYEKNVRTLALLSPCLEE
jgi:hypothetical protein